MSLPEAASPSAPARKPRRIRAVVLIGLLLSAAGTLIAIKLRSPMPAVGGATNQVANPAEAVALNAFVQPETRRWRGIPQGTQVCDNVTFICTGALRIAGLQAARDGNRYPGAVLGVPVDRRGTRLHLLQAAENAAEMIEGEAYARLVLHYANGEIRKLDLLFGIHGDDWFQNEADPNDVVADPNSRPAWIHRRKGDGKIIRIYHTILDNPLPGINLSFVDFISPLSEANLLLFGLAINDEPRILAPAYGPGETIGDPQINPITFKLQDAAGQPLPGGSLAWIAQGRRVQIDFPPFPANATAEVRIEVPGKSIREIRYKASAPNGASASGSVKPSRGSFPLEQVVKLLPPDGQ